MVNMNIVRNIRHNFYTFCHQTSLHGWQYMRSSHSDQSSACCRLFRIVFWSLIVIVSLGCAAFSLYYNAKGWQQ